MHVIVKCQRKNFSSEVHDIFTKETEQGYISMFLVNDHEGRFHWVDFEQCVLSAKLENERKEIHFVNDPINKTSMCLEKNCPILSDEL